MSYISTLEHRWNSWTFVHWDPLIDTLSEYSINFSKITSENFGPMNPLHKKGKGNVDMWEKI